MASAIPLEANSSRAGATVVDPAPDVRRPEPAIGDVSIVDTRDSGGVAARAENRACACEACAEVRRVPFRCDGCGYTGEPLVAACAGSVDGIDVEIARCNRRLQQINASGRDSYRERVVGTARTIKHTRREVEARLAALTRSRQLIAAHVVCVTSDDCLRGLLACPCCGTGELAESDQGLRERRSAFVRDILRLAESHHELEDPTEFATRVWRLAAKYL
ncbi:MAG TPA: hypothetical protein VIP11_19300 [Gemmatimonadaceae bacterium]